MRAGIDRSLRHPVMFFLTSGAAWLAVSIFLGVIASAKVHSPGFLSSWSFLTYGRVFPAHLNALVYGWGMQAAFAMIIWLMARLSRKECTMVGTILTAGHVWNLGVSLGVIGILTGHGTGMPWMEFPSFAWPVLLVSYFAIMIGSFIQFRVRPEGHVYISQWYLLAAMLWFPWIFITANTLLHCVPGHPLMGAGISAWFRSAMIFLFFTPVALGTAYYLAPKVTGRPIYSYALAKLGFWSLAVIAPWAGMQKLVGAPIPYFLPYIGAAATALLFIPACAAAINTIRTMLSNPETLAASPSLRFTVAGISGLIILAVAAVLLNLPGSARVVVTAADQDALPVLGLWHHHRRAGGAVRRRAPRRRPGGLATAMVGCRRLRQTLCRGHHLLMVPDPFFQHLLLHAPRPDVAAPRPPQHPPHAVGPRARLRQPAR